MMQVTLEFPDGTFARDDTLPFLPRVGDRLFYSSSPDPQRRGGWRVVRVDYDLCGETNASEAPIYVWLEAWPIPTE